MSDKKFKFNAFDAIIILIFILILSAIGIKIYEKSNQSVNDTHKFSFTIEAKNLDQNFKDKISVGDKIRDSVHGFFYGCVSNLKVKPAQKIVENNINGTYILTDIPQKNDLEITVECKANVTDDAITVDGHPIRIGKLMSLKSKGYVVYGYIIDMEVE